MSTSIRLTIHDMEALPEDDGKRYELIDGELHVTTQPHIDHQLVADAICGVLRAWCRRTKAGVAVSAPGVIFSEDEAVAPDVVWVRRDRLGHVLEEDGKLHAAPDLAVEVLSPGKTHESRDRKIKPARYAFWGVPEYWLVDRFTRTVEVYRLEGVAFVHIVTLDAAEVLTSPMMPEFACQVNEFFVDLEKVV